MDPAFQLTRHILLKQSGSEELLACNAAQRTELVISRSDWAYLSHFGAKPLSPADAGPEPSATLLTRAIETKILVSGPESVDLLERTAALRFELRELIGRHSGLTQSELDELLSESGEDLFPALIRFGRNFFQTVNTLRHEQAKAVFQEPYVAFAQRQLIAAFDLAIAFYRQTQPDAQVPYRIDPELCLDMAARSASDRRPGMPVSQTNLADLVVRDYPRGATVLVLGDADLVGLAFPDHRRYQIHVVEADPGLVELLKFGIERRGLTNVQVHALDIGEGFPEALKCKFDAVVTSPPHAPKAMTTFLLSADMAIKNRKAAKGLRKIYLSATPSLIDDHKLFLDDFAKKQFLLVDQRANFSQYLIDQKSFSAELLFFTGRVQYPGRNLGQLLECPFYYSDLFEGIYTDKDFAKSPFRN